MAPISAPSSDGTAGNLRRTHPDVHLTQTSVSTIPFSGLSGRLRKPPCWSSAEARFGAFKRLTVGSTSIALAGRSPAPTVIVPDTWDASESDGESILVGLSTSIRSRDELLAFGFARAAELGVPLVVMHVWDTHPAVVPGDDDLKRWGDEARAAVEAAIAPWRRSSQTSKPLPHSDMRTMRKACSTPATGHPQRVVLGRHSVGHSPLGLPLRSTTRTVLDYCERPVAVVPTAVDS